MLFTSPILFQRRRFRSFGLVDFRFSENIKILKEGNLISKSLYPLITGEKLLSKLSKIDLNTLIQSFISKINNKGSLVHEGKLDVIDFSVLCFIAYITNSHQQTLQDLIDTGERYLDKYHYRIDILASLGFMYEKIQRLDESLSCFNLAVKEKNDISFIYSKNALLINSLIIYEKMYNLVEAKRIEKLLCCSNSLSDDDKLRLFVDRSIIYEKEGDYNKAYKIVDEGSEFNKDVNNKYAISKINTVKGIIKACMGEYRDACRFFELSKDNDAYLKNNKGMIKSYCNQASTLRLQFENTGNLSSLGGSRRLYKKALGECKKEPVSRNTRLGVLEQITETYTDSGEFKKALDSIEEALLLLNNVSGYEYKYKRLLCEKQIIKSFIASKKGRHIKARDGLEQSSKLLLQLNDEYGHKYYDTLATLEDAEDISLKGETKIAYCQYEWVRDEFNRLSLKSEHNNKLKLYCQYYAYFSEARALWEKAVEEEKKINYSDAINKYYQAEKILIELAKISPKFINGQIIDIYSKYAKARADKLRLILKAIRNSDNRLDICIGLLVKTFKEISQIFLNSSFSRLSKCALLDMELMYLFLIENHKSYNLLDRIIKWFNWKIKLFNIKRIAKNAEQWWLLDAIKNKLAVGLIGNRVISSSMTLPIYPDYKIIVKTNGLNSPSQKKPLSTDHTVVFISYSHDSDEHRERVLELSERLRRSGFDTRLDRYVNGAPEEGWPRWMLDRLDEANFVLVVCTEIYYRRFRGHEQPDRGKGVDWEGTLITQEIYDNRSRTLKYVPVLFDDAHKKYIPEPLRRLTHYTLHSEANYIDLFNFLNGVAGVEPGPIG